MITIPPGMQIAYTSCCTVVLQPILYSMLVIFSRQHQVMLYYVIIAYTGYQLSNSYLQQVACKSCCTVVLQPMLYSMLVIFSRQHVSHAVLCYYWLCYKVCQLSSVDSMLYSMLVIFSRQHVSRAVLCYWLCYKVCQLSSVDSIKLCYTVLLQPMLYIRLHTIYIVSLIK